MEIRQARVPSSSGNGSYAVDLDKNYCECPAWRFQKKPAGERFCKHMAELVRINARAN